MVRIDLKPLKNGIHEFDWDPEPGDLDLDPDMFHSLHLHVRLDVHPANIYARITAEGIARLICDRTLVPFDERIAGSYAVLYVTAGAIRDEDEELEDIVVLAPEENELDLTEAVRDTYLLALPQRRVAPGADDLDIPLQFGAPADDEVVDPRWEALRKLREG